VPHVTSFVFLFPNCPFCLTKISCELWIFKVNNEIKHPKRSYVLGFGIFVVKNNTSLLFEMLPSQPAPLVSQGDHLPAPPQELLSLRLFDLGFAEPFPRL
jgi:hypothetical protein